MPDTLTTGRDAPFTWRSPRWLTEAPALAWRRPSGVVDAVTLAPVVSVDDELAVYAAATITGIDKSRRLLTAPDGVAAPRGGGAGDAWLMTSGGWVGRVRVQSVVGQVVTLASPVRADEVITAEAPAWVQWATYVGELRTDTELAASGTANWAVNFAHLDGKDSHRGVTRVEYRFDPGLSSGELIDQAKHLQAQEDRRADLSGPIEHARSHIVTRLRARLRPRTESIVSDPPAFLPAQVAYVVWWLERDIDARKQRLLEADRIFDEICASLDLDRDQDGVPDPLRSAVGVGDFRGRTPGMTSKIRRTEL